MRILLHTHLQHLCQLHIHLLNMPSYERYLPLHEHKYIFWTCLATTMVMWVPWVEASYSIHNQVHKHAQLHQLPVMHVYVFLLIKNQVDQGHSPPHQPGSIFWIVTSYYGKSQMTMLITTTTTTTTTTKKKKIQGEGL